MQKAVEEELGKAMVKRVELFRDLLARTPVDELQVRRHPAVIFRPGENMWIEAIVRYLVTPREAGSVKNRLVMLLLDRLNAQPDRTRFPKGNLRWGGSMIMAVRSDTNLPLSCGERRRIVELFCERMATLTFA